MQIQNINTYNQFNFKSCIKYRQHPEKLPRKTLQLINRVHEHNEYLKTKGYKIAESYLPRIKYLDKVDEAYFKE